MYLLNISTPFKDFVIFMLNQVLELGDYFLTCIYSFVQMKANLITDHF